MKSKKLVNFFIIITLAHFTQAEASTEPAPSRRATEKTLLEIRSLLSKKDAATTKNSLGKLSTMLLNQRMDYDLRVKASILLGSLCSKSAAVAKDCKAALDPLIQLNDNSRIKKQLVSYVKQFTTAYHVASVSKVNQQRPPLVADKEPEPARPQAQEAAQSPTNKPFIAPALLLGVMGVFLTGLYHWKSKQQKNHLIQSKILVVDDDLIYLRIVERLLRGRFTHLDLVSKPSEALEKLKENSFDVVLVDYLMPTMDGVEFAQKAAEMNNCLNPNIVFFTGNAGLIFQKLTQVQSSRSANYKVVEKIPNMRRLKTRLLKACATA